MDAFEIKPLSAKLGTWVMALATAELRLASANGDTTILMSRAGADEQFEIVPLWAGQAALNLKRPGQPTLQFRLDKSQHEKLKVWLGSPSKVRLTKMLKRRYSLGLLIGVLFIVASIPLAGDPAKGIDPVPFDPVSLVLGLGLVGFWFGARVRPTRSLYLADSVWFVLLAGSAVRDMLLGRSGPLWVFWLVFPLWLAWSGFKQYRELSALESAPGEQQAA